MGVTEVSQQEFQIEKMNSPEDISSEFADRYEEVLIGDLMANTGVDRQIATEMVREDTGNRQGDLQQAVRDPRTNLYTVRITGSDPEDVSSIIGVARVGWEQYSDRPELGRNRLFYGLARLAHNLGVVEGLRERGLSRLMGRGTLQIFAYGVDSEALGYDPESGRQLFRGIVGRSVEDLPGAGQISIYGGEENPVTNSRMEAIDGGYVMGRPVNIALRAGESPWQSYRIVAEAPGHSSGADVNR